MKVINLYGGPGSGKSTVAAAVFANLKQAGYNVELVREYAKDTVYEQRYNLLKHQLYITAKQYKRMKDIQDYGQVPLIITDSPLKLSLFYGQHLAYYNSFRDVVLRLYEEFDNFDVFLTRTKEYNPSGRTQTHEEAKQIDQFFFYHPDLQYNLNINGNGSGITELTQKIKKLL